MLLLYLSPPLLFYHLNFKYVINNKYNHGIFEWYLNDNGTFWWILMWLNMKVSHHMGLPHTSRFPQRNNHMLNFYVMTNYPLISLMGFMSRHPFIHRHFSPLIVVYSLFFFLNYSLFFFKIMLFLL